MVKYVSECVGCSSIYGTCMKGACPYYSVPVFICDDCGEEVPYGELFEFDGEQLCIDCIKKQLEVVEAA